VSGPATPATQAFRPLPIVNLTKGVLHVELVQLELRYGTHAGAGAVAVVTLNDPSRRNALSVQLVAELIEAMDTLENDPHVGAVVVTGAPPAFCAGADLGNLATEQERVSEVAPESEARLRGVYEGFLRVAHCALPTVAAVNGPAVGAGMNLALACDARIAGRSARFVTRFLDLGLHPGGGHTFMLQRVAGQQLAAAMVLFGERLDGETAAAHGLAWRCVEDDELIEEAVSFATRAASAPRALAIRAKDTLRRAAALDEHDEAIDLELAAQMWSLGEPFFAERLAALRARVAGESSSEP
jgi:enoyl-CoA hydratase